MKTNKSARSRIRVTRQGKLIVRKKGHGHFNAKEPRSKQLNRKRSERLVLPKKVQQRMLLS